MGGKLLVAAVAATRRILPIDVHLQQYGEIEADLQRPTDPELRWRVSKDKVTSPEHITSRPHDHHADAHTMRRLILIIPKKLGCTQHSFGKDGKEPDRLHEPRHR